MKKESRFQEIYNEGGVICNNQIIVDTKTGVNYLMVQAGYSIAVTPLIDKDGKPVVSEVV